MPFLCMIYKITNLFKIFLIFSTLIVLISSTFSERRLCGDQKCSVIISRGTTTLRYHATQEYKLSFNVNQPVRILAKSVESNLWYVEITGRRGYVPYTLIREETVLVKKDQLIEVPVVESIDNNQNSSPNHLVLAENIKITDDTDIKSSQIINPDEVVSSTTTSPVAADDNNTDQNIQINVDEKFTDQDKLESENIVFDSELKKNGELETAKIYSLENNEENTVNQHYDDHHHHHGLPALFNALPNHNHDIKPKENIDNLPEQTTPSYNNLPLPDNNYDTSTIKPIEQPLKNSGGTEN